MDLPTQEEVDKALAGQARLRHTLEKVDRALLHFCNRNRGNPAMWRLRDQLQRRRNQLASEVEKHMRLCSQLIASIEQRKKEGAP